MRCVTAVLALSLVGAASAQDSPSAEFEVASIKRSATPPPGNMRTLSNGETIISSTPIRIVISRGYDFDDVVGVPSWASDGYDVHVKPPTGASREQIKEMWQSLLASRMKFASHYETREVPAYTLVLARSDGRLGPELKLATVECATAGTQSVITGGPNKEEALKHCETMSAPGLLASGSVLMERFAFYLGAPAGRPVTDATGLAGRYSVALTYSIPSPPGSGRPPSGTPDAPEVFTAVQEQLGLKLQSSTTQSQVLVIDHIERPTEN
jgi:uncharacterized protein (TIGR03435 family)